MKKVLKLSCFTCLIVWIFLLFFANQSMADTYCVSNEANLIAALNDAKDNGADDVIKIQQGTYNGNFVYASTESFGVTIEGGYTALCASRVVDPNNTVLDGGQNGVVLALSVSDVAVNFSVDGLTIQNGNVDVNGGGLFIFNSDGGAKISNTKVANNSAGSGGGIYISEAGTIELVKNIITQNYVTDNGPSAGLRIYTSARNSTIIISENTISNNSGGGVFIVGTRASVIMSNNTIANNTCSRRSCEGGGFRIDAIDFVLLGNIICGNSASHSGGGGSIQSTGAGFSTVNLIGNTICNNPAGGFGGGLNIWGSFEIININNNTINDNSSGGHGGGIWLAILRKTTLLNVINNTIARNITDEDGGGIWFIAEVDNQVSNFYNNIIWGNTAETGSDLFIRNDNDGNYIPATVNLFNNDFDQSENGTYIQRPFTIDPSNLDNEDPLFVDPDIGDFHLTVNSPCIDAGAAIVSFGETPDGISYAQAAPSDDIDGDSRPRDNGYDIGADEYPGPEYWTDDRMRNARPMPMPNP